MASFDRITIKKLAESIGKIMKPLSNTPMDISNPDLGVAGILDVETTDINNNTIEITELALRRFIYNKVTNELIAPLDCYNELNEPVNMDLLTIEVQKITGIKPEDLVGKKIDFNEVKVLIESCDFVIAHNAEFDKDKVLRYLPDLKVKWLCSYKMIDWDRFDVPAKKLDLLALFFGFDYEAHRASNDVDATYELLAVSGTFKELAEQRTVNFYKCVITGYLDAYQKSDVKDYIKNQNDMGYTFNYSPNPKPHWFCSNVKKEDMDKVRTTILDKVLKFNPKGFKDLKVEFID